MSWSVSTTGKVPAVRKSLEGQFNNYTCNEPEESVRQAAAKLIAAALDAQEEGTVLRVSASGCQSTKYGEDRKPTFTNQLKVDVEPIYGFVE